MTTKNDVDTEIIEVLKAYKRYPYGTKEEPHITGDVAQTRLKALIGTIAEQIKADTEKAYGGCHNCYGKGYATVKSQIIGYGTDGDIGGYEGKYKHDTPTQMKFCDCDRGQRLKDYMEKNNE